MDIQFTLDLAKQEAYVDSFDPKPPAPLAQPLSEQETRKLIKLTAEVPGGWVIMETRLEGFVFEGGNRLAVLSYAEAGFPYNEQILRQIEDNRRSVFFKLRDRGINVNVIQPTDDEDPVVMLDKSFFAVVAKHHKDMGHRFDVEI
jgi:hypothetical protein